jgi:hypothetical protein
MAQIISVQGKYLYKPDGTRFFMKGIAFPAPLQSQDYNETGWIQTLKQIKVDLGTNVNTIRLYRMDPFVNYSGFFDYAASIGVYIMVPLTSYTIEPWPRQNAILVNYSNTEWPVSTITCRYE